MYDYDILILGGGPAGMSALIWSHSLGLRGLILERANELGGQMLLMYHRIIDYPGLLPANGHDLKVNFTNHLRAFQLSYRLDCAIEEIDLRGLRLRTDGRWLASRALIVATGARKRRLGIPGENEFEGNGVSFSATRDHPLFAGRDVVVVGGGDSAVENCLILARVCRKVTLIHRSDSLRARQDWVKQVMEKENFTMLTNAEVKVIGGDKETTHVVVEDLNTGERRSIPTQGVFVRVGSAPNSETLAGQLDLDSAGGILIDSQQQTSAPMVFAAGDVCRPIAMSVASAVGQGANAAKAIAEILRLR